jgi:poly-beta-1,6-N-acetyl-D-glucosamine synthase
MFFLFVVFALYIVLLLICIGGFYLAVHRSRQNSSDDGGTKEVTVIIPFRNESANLEPLISSLKRQNHPQFNVFLIDDHSTDGSFELTQRLMGSDDRFHLFRSEGSGKKNALTLGIDAAATDIIVTSDADCLFGPEWLPSITRPFNRQDTRFVFGTVVYTSATFFQRLQQLEFSAVVGSGIAAAGLGRPVYCNGANLAFRKSAFSEVGGYTDNVGIPSGDDEFLLKKILRQYPKGIEFVPDQDAIVQTHPSVDLKTFFHQRLRWAGKWRYSEGVTSKAAALFVLVVQFTVLLSLFSILLTDADRTLAYLLGGKIVLEFVFLFVISQYSGNRFRFMDFVLLQLLFPLYVVVVGVLSNVLPYRWKGRTLKSKITADKRNNSQAA